jgi:hypothetical protein
MSSMSTAEPARVLCDTTDAAEAPRLRNSAVSAQAIRTHAALPVRTHASWLLAAAAVGDCTGIATGAAAEGAAEGAPAPLAAGRAGREEDELPPRAQSAAPPARQPLLTGPAACG